MWLKLAVTAWTIVLVASYAIDSAFGLLWFCNVGLILTVVGLWTESPLLVSMPAVGNVPWLLLWCGHLVVKLVGMVMDQGMIDGPSSYMFNSEYPFWARFLSIYHGWLPFVLIYAVARIGYDRRALLYQTLLGWTLILAAYLLVPNSDTPAGNVNMVFGYTADRDPVLWTSRPVWVVLLFVLVPLTLYLPAHAVCVRLFGDGRD